MKKAVFQGLVFDEFDKPADVGYIGDEPCYILDDAGFKRHISAEYVDSQVLDQMKSQISGNEDLISEQTAKMLGQDDLFSKAVIDQQLRNIDEHLDRLYQEGLPEASRAYMGMTGFKVVIDYRGDLIRLEQPTAPMPGDEQ
ncbi:MAG TPA: hypothetical protein PKD55_09565 [Bellilinea sp.]|nr:hypothetical protein [Bellilinea sp.]